MALTPEERAARMEELKAAREKKYFATQTESKAAAEALLPELPQPDAYIYSYAWRQDVGAPTGEYKLIKTPNPYYDASTNTIVDPATGKRTTATQSMWSGATTFRGTGTATSTTKKVTSSVKNPDGSTTVTYDDNTTAVIPASTVVASPTGVSNTGVSTNLDVLKSVLRGLGYNASIIDASSSFLLALLKDGLDYDNAVEVFLNSKDYTLKDGKKIDSPFYAEYGYLNEGLVRPRGAAELYNAVEGYKEVAANYNLNSKFLSKDYLKKYVKNNVSASDLAQRANLARLKAVNADPAYLDSLRRLGYISSAADLTDFFLDPEVGQETLNQRRATAAFGAEAIKRAKQGVQFSTERFNKIVTGLLGLGLSPEQAEVRAAEGFENIAESLLPMGKLSNIYERLPKEDLSAIQQELETEEFGGMASQRRKRLKELETRTFQGEVGTARGISFKGPSAAGIL